MKKNVLWVVILVLFSCNANINNPNKDSLPNDIKNAQIQEALKVECFCDSVLNKMIALRSNWFDSWNWDKKTIKGNDFYLDGETDLKLEWEIYDPLDPYIKQYDSLLIYSEGNLALDLYSYNTLIEKEDGSVFVEFDVDTKPYVVNRINMLRFEIMTVGPAMMIEDGLWLDSKKIVLLGYLQKDVIVPFLSLIDIETKKIITYNYAGSFIEKRGNYFFVKYPNAKLRYEE